MMKTLIALSSGNLEMQIKRKTYRNSIERQRKFAQIEDNSIILLILALMATSASHLIRNQNLNISSNGATLGGKTDVIKGDKKGGLGARKALNDISNSRNATMIQTKRDLSVSKTKSVVGGKAGGRKALSDLSNSVKPPSLQVVPKKGQKLNPIAEENVPVCIEEEGFLHNHHECIKIQGKAMDVDYFLKSVIGLDNDIPMRPSSPRAFVSSSKPKLESPVEHMEMEIPELLFEDQVSSCRKTNIPGHSSLSWGSPKSPKLPFTDWMNDSFSDFMLMESPKLLNP
ncbi:unnamed protein product [Fraxinus pennsylvanica]|uniref:Uncharacterized protein n=1 Tax=Fraxinus pennsylvanica TaxID=56036 RepID=A0AAD1ZGR6_9LAMI|nr:unnamed protein product [Fraxinus pennsylvanica]